MKKYYFKENFHLFRANGQLYNSKDEEEFTYQSVSTILPEIHVYHWGKEIGHITTEFRLFLREYGIYSNLGKIDSLKQEFTFFTPKLTLEKTGVTIEGDFFALDYELRSREGKLLAEVDQEIFHMTKQYTVTIYDEPHEDVLILLIIAINEFDKAADNNASNIHINSNN
ncbi:MAG: hypothetical protein II704_05290 [Erysipelotrichaceae bacterium]|nr:hypothetical protein [Erysipelotrichaceae bacterium]